ncbi:DUF2769 domain-containing protein [Methanocella arvoryzae]|uniref:DUF2769 domain-containing protein n=1 Tax=Methanocella arvoryzae (strain DSM 22066 / NBRC 105507 / MRE50) TaxID=351160 RepID=Q0W0M9_METAR|nr:DUF2769 domain-containing protein [Methanocella arvoryzae]CAJ38064.1 hypothetical protein RRC345 [Methanocella arvoryzae MRE50]
MDKFDETVQSLKDLGPEDRKSKLQTFANECKCPVCPSYTECAKNDNEGIFCLQGNSFRCIGQINGCNCPACGVKQGLGMKDMMYCMKGSEFETRYLDNLR